MKKTLSHVGLGLLAFIVLLISITQAVPSAVGESTADEDVSVILFVFAVGLTGFAIAVIVATAIRRSFGIPIP